METMERKKIQLQYQLKPTSEMILWDAISTPSGLESWFADKVIMANNREVTFRWADEERHAKVVGFRSFSYIRFRWADSDFPREYFEIKMAHDELTSDFTLVITDFADVAEAEDYTLLWDHQVQTLCRNYGF
jgi:uncharacterized protein YndB with AHSA1/START domain